MHRCPSAPCRCEDWHQSVQAEEALAITHTKLAVITWREPAETIPLSSGRWLWPTRRRSSGYLPVGTNRRSSSYRARTSQPPDQAARRGAGDRGEGPGHLQRAGAPSRPRQHPGSPGFGGLPAGAGRPGARQEPAPGAGVGPSRKGARQEGLPTSSATAGLAACAETGFAHGTGPRPQDRCGVAGGQGTRRPMDAASSCVRREFSPRSSRDLVNDRGLNDQDVRAPMGSPPSRSGSHCLVGLTSRCAARVRRRGRLLHPRTVPCCRSPSVPVRVRRRVGPRRVGGRLDVAGLALLITYRARRRPAANSAARPPCDQIAPARNTQRWRGCRAACQWWRPLTAAPTRASGPRVTRRGAGEG